MPQSYTCLHHHIIFGTKHRKPFLTPTLRERVLNYIAGIIKEGNGNLMSSGGTHDHVHLLVGVHPDTAPATLLRLIKANSSKWVHHNFPDQARFAWQTGYAAFTVSRSNFDEVRSYIENQEEHHQGLSFEDEFKQFLDRHGIRYDPRYLWG
ncbi:MAG: IS200/IS605 family transposase [bacterium]|nr:IS200/IS605 family transposase [bacterium]